jgi:hypothetical protein
MAAAPSPGPIVIGTDSGTYWTGNSKEPWTDNAQEAKAYGTPEAALTAARRVAKGQAAALEGSPLYLDERNEDGGAQRRVRLDGQETPAGLRRAWASQFRRNLPEDLVPGAAAEPAPPAQEPAQAPERITPDEIRANLARRRHGAAAARTDEPNEIGPGPLDREQITPEEAQAALARRRQGEAQRQPAAATAAPAEAQQQAPGAQADPNEVERGTRARATEAEARGDTDASSPGMPSFVRRHFVAQGEQFYFRDKPQQKAFRAGKDSFRAQDVSQPVAKALVELAAERGWSSIKVKGTTEFKALVWAAAQERGLAVEGYHPQPGEKAAASAQERPKQPAATAAPAPETAAPEARERPQPEQARAPASTADPMRGDVLAYGPAPYKHQAQGSPSFRVKLRAADGSEHEHWGVGLEDAMRDSGAKVGDSIKLERGPKEPVTVQSADGSTRTVQRQAWRAERLPGPGPAPAAASAKAPAPAAAPAAAATPRDPQMDAARKAVEQRVQDPAAREAAMRTAQAHLAELRGKMAGRPTTPPNEVAAGRAKPARGAERDR